MVRFPVNAATSMKLTVFLDVEPCSIVEINILSMDIVRDSETSLTLNPVTRRNVPEDSDFYVCLLYDNGLCGVLFSSRAPVLSAAPTVVATTKSTTHNR